MKTKLEKILLTTNILCLIVIGALIYLIVKPNGVFQLSREVEVKTGEEIAKQTNINVAQPAEGDKVSSYKILNDDTSEIKYKRGDVNITYRATKNPSLDIARISEEWDPSFIAMNISFDDDTSKEIKTYRAKNNFSVVLTEWEDNGYFYSMQSDNANNIEVYLKEVDRVVRENHEISKVEKQIKESLQAN